MVKNETSIRNFKIRGYFIRNIKKTRIGKGRYRYSGEVWYKTSVTSPIIRKYGDFRISAENLTELKDHLSIRNFGIYVRKDKTKDYKTDLLVLFTEKNKEKKGRLIIAMGILNNLEQVSVRYSELNITKIKNMRKETAKKIVRRFHQTMYSKPDIKKYRK